MPWTVQSTFNTLRRVVPTDVAREYRKYLKIFIKLINNFSKCVQNIQNEKTKYTKNANIFIKLIYVFASLILH